MSTSQSESTDKDDLEQFTNDHTELLSRILAYGGSEAQGYALAVIANGATAETIDEVQAQLDEIRRDIQ